MIRDSELQRFRSWRQSLAAPFSQAGSIASRVVDLIKDSVGDPVDRPQRPLVFACEMRVLTTKPASQQPDKEGNAARQSVFK